MAMTGGGPRVAILLIVLGPCRYSTWVYDSHLLTECSMSGSKPELLRNSGVLFNVALALMKRP